jgi:hypothetical protein
LRPVAVMSEKPSPNTAPGSDPDPVGGPRVPHDDRLADTRLAPEHPKGQTDPLPPENPSHGTIDESGEHP